MEMLKKVNARLRGEVTIEEVLKRIERGKVGKLSFFTEINFSSKSD
jgi:hypothetical protein